MAGLIWSPRAVRDLDEICEFVARDSEKYARIVAEQIVTLIENLPAQPRAASIVPEYDCDDLRERFVYSYRVIYRLGDDRVEVVTIIHAARLIPRDLLDR
jgi:plasmid stabilization system protein ParE